MTLTQECIDTLYTNKQRRGIRELVSKYHTDHYELFRRFVIESGDVKFIKWFLTSSPDVYKDVIKGILLFHNYRFLHLFNKHNIGLKPFLHMVEDDRTATDIIKGTVPYEKLNV